ncbi:MAG TPA: OmpH family outer membrane protein [Thermoanaerobaculia bacterium]|nr:OmpH family outer membrane protein [Thermoanaerobaculia bacterium]
MNRILLSLVGMGMAAGALGQAPTTAPAAAAAPAGPLKIAVINVDRLVTDSALGKEAFARVKKVADQKKEEGEKLTKELREMEQKLADQGASLADDKKDALQKQYQEKAIAFKRFQDDAQRQLDEAQKKELEELQKRVMPVISQIGKERGFTLIFNKYQSGLVYADDGSDITDEVLKRFNTTVAVPAAEKPAAAAPTGAAAKPTPKKPS